MAEFFIRTLAVSSFFPSPAKFETTSVHCIFFCLVLLVERSLVQPLAQPIFFLRIDDSHYSHAKQIFSEVYWNQPVYLCTKYSLFCVTNCFYRFHAIILKVCRYIEVRQDVIFNHVFQMVQSLSSLELRKFC